MAHRADLAYYILELAFYAKTQQINFKGLFHPDNWLWVDDGVGSGRVVFANALSNSEAGDPEFKQEMRFCAIVYKGHGNHKAFLPDPFNSSNLHDCIVYAMMLVAGRFDTWLDHGNTYISHANLGNWNVNDGFINSFPPIEEKLLTKLNAALIFLG